MFTPQAWELFKLRMWLKAKNVLKFLLKHLWVFLTHRMLQVRFNDSSDRPVSHMPAKTRYCRGITDSGLHLLAPYNFLLPICHLDLREFRDFIITPCHISPPTVTRRIMRIKQNSTHTKRTRRRHRISVSILKYLRGLRKINPVDSNFTQGPERALGLIHRQNCYPTGPITYNLRNYIPITRMRGIMHKQKLVTPGFSPRAVLMTMPKSPNMPSLRGSKNINLWALLRPVHKGTKYVRTES